MNLFKLFGEIIVKNSDANAAIDETTDKAESSSTSFVEGATKVAAWGAAVVAAASAAVVGVTKFAMSAASSADNIDKMSQKIGISREAYQELDFICSQSGTTVDTLQAGLKTLTNTMQGVADGTDSSIEKFEKLGVSVMDSEGNLRSQEDVMWETLEALQGMENQTEKAALATDLFGRSGTELMPLLNGATGSIEDMKQQAHDLGLILDDDVIDAGVEVTDTVDQMQRAFQAVGTKMAAALLPTVQSLSDVIIENMPLIQELAEELAPLLVYACEEILPPLLQLAIEILPHLIESVKLIVPIIEWVIEFLVESTNGIVDMIKSALNIIIYALEMFISLFSGDLKGAVDAGRKMMDNVEKYASAFFRSALGNIYKYIQGWVEKTLHSIRMFGENLSTSIGTAIYNIRTKVTTTFTNIHDAITSKIQNAVNTVKSLVDRMKELFNFQWSIPHISLPHFKVTPSGWNMADLLKGTVPKLGIEWYEKGGILNSPTIFGMNGEKAMIGGEAGAEAVAPIETLQRYVSDAVARQNSGIIEAINNVFAYLQEYMPELANTQVVLDTGALVGGIAPSMNARLGKYVGRSERGVHS